MIPVRETLLAGNWVGEADNFQVSNSSYGSRELKVFLLAVSSVTTIQMIQDSVFNIEDQIAMDISESFAQTEGQAFVNGNGVNKPEGLLARVNGSIVGTTAPNAGIAYYPSGIANGFDADSLINIAGELKTGYNPMYLANRRTLAYIRTLKDGIGQYLWTPGLANQYPNMINGWPYMSTIDVPDIDVNSYPVIFGDIYRGYTIADHIALYMIRDNYTQSAAGEIVFNVLRRVGGMVTLGEAILALKCATF
jgi:HK97 family phage major capsid protein